MIRATYLRSLLLGSAGLIISILGIVGVVGLLRESLSWDRVFTVFLVLAWIVLSWLQLVRSRPRIEVSAAGVRQTGIGAWRLAWAEIATASISAAELVLEPSADAMQRQSVRTASQWSKFFAGGRHGRGAIVLPRPHCDDAATKILREHGLVH